MGENVCPLMGGILLVGIGLLGLLNPDLLWKWKVFNARLNGQAESSLERTPEWETGNCLGGCGFVIFGVALAILALLPS
jgi:hypothetical protein